MKKILFFALSLILLSACGADKENKVENFGKNFAAYVNASQLDSIKAVYPSANFDAVTPVSADSLTVIENGNGTYRISFSGDTWVDVTVEENGDIKVLESNGIAAFPEEKYEMGKNTGMFNDNPTDVVKAERLNDSAFFEWLNQKAAKASSNAVSLTPGTISYNFKMDYDAYDDYVRMYQAVEKVTVTNNTSADIKGSEYSVSYVYKTWACCEYEGWVPSSKTVPGVNLAPGESKTITLTSTYDEWGKKPKLENPRVNLKISQQDAAKFFQPSGAEYQEYLDSKK